MLRTVESADRHKRGRRRRPQVSQIDQPSRAPLARATIVASEPLADEDAATAWLESLRRDRKALAAYIEGGVWVLNRMLRAHRAAVADPYVREVHPDTALSRRAGYGDGPSVAEGRYAAAIELPLAARRRRRSEQLRPQERLAAVLGGRERLLACEELVMRARLDVDAGSPREAALQARVALEAMLAEVGPTGGGSALTELENDRVAIAEAANAALDGDLSEPQRLAVESAVDHMRRMLTRLSLEER